MHDTGFLLVQNLSFKQKQENILQSIDLDLPAQGLIALIGANGAGKSTLLKILSGQLRPHKGSVTWDGKSCDNLCGKVEEIGYMAEKGQFYADLTVREQLEFMAELKCSSSQQPIDALLDQMSLTDHAHKKCGHLSLGYRQRLGLAQALLGEPRLLLLDEPMNGMDPDLQLFFKHMLKDLKKRCLVMMSTHMIHDAEELADHAVFMRQGRIQHQAFDLGQQPLMEIYAELNQTTTEQSA
ncbi:ABC transporter ATP-binding protein [Marinicella sp. W31]|uniref:ABC transporter ATP-binding protein n=1 Tax=Marinicella sp. W31 TaxID=3023713 RepID=UPI00375632A3